MKKLRTFWHVLTKSTSDPAYYIEVLRSPLFFSVKFFLFLLLLLSVCDVVVFRVREIPLFITSLTKESEHALSQLPDTFTVAYTPDGKLSTQGVARPFAVASSSEFAELSGQKTFLTLTKDETPDPSSLISLTPTQIDIHSNIGLSDASRPMLYKELFDSQAWSLTKKQIEEKRTQLIQSLPAMATLFTFFAVPVLFLAMICATALTLFVLTILAHSCAWIMGIHMPFIKTFQLGLHAIAVATLVDVAKYALYPHADVSLVIPAYLGIMSLVLWSLKTRRVSVKTNS